jgi:peptide/nickel transport system substrate-binding protein
LEVFGATSAPRDPDPDDGRLLDEEARYIYTLQWQRIVPYNAKVRGWTITPSHYLNQQLDAVSLAE